MGGKYCCVPGCFKTNGYFFPKDPEMRMRWRVAIRREGPKKKLWEPGEYSVVCRDHFLPSDFTVTSAERPRLKKDAVPSIFNFKSSHAISTDRHERALKRAKQVEDIRSSRDVKEADNTDTDLIFFEFDVQEIIIDESRSKDQNANETLDEGPEAMAVESIPNGSGSSWPRFRIESIKDQPKAIKLYTGFVNFDHFKYLYDCLGPAVDCLAYKSELDPLNELFFTLMKLRTNRSLSELSFEFGVGESVGHRIFSTWLSFLFFQLKELKIWPSKEVVEAHFPADFKRKFPKTRTILDGTEVAIEKPRDVSDQSASWSTYKHKNTVKTIIGITPRGQVSYISDVYGGSASDRQIIERSDLVKDGSLFERGDSIMSDRGIMVQDIFWHLGVSVNTPTPLRNKTQLSSKEVVNDRRISSKRIHVERIIGYAKTFRILKHINSSLTPLAGKIIFVCFALVNFRPTIVSSKA